MIISGLSKIPDDITCLVSMCLNHPLLCRPPGPLTDPLTDKPEFIVPIVLLVAVVIIILAVVLFIKVKK